MAGKTIGEQNGWRVKSLSVLLIVWPVIVATDLPWRIWITVQTFENKAFREAGNRYTATDGATDRAAAKEYTDTQIRRLETEIHTLPPQLWRDKINATEEMVRENREMLIRIEAALRADPNQSAGMHLWPSSHTRARYGEAKKEDIEGLQERVVQEGT